MYKYFVLIIAFSSCAFGKQVFTIDPEWYLDMILGASNDSEEKEIASSANVLQTELEDHIEGKTDLLDDSKLLDERKVYFRKQRDNEIKVCKKGIEFIKTITLYGTKEVVFADRDKVRHYVLENLSLEETRRLKDEIIDLITILAAKIEDESREGSPFTMRNVYLTQTALTTTGMMGIGYFYWKFLKGRQVHSSVMQTMLSNKIPTAFAFAGLLATAYVTAAGAKVTYHAHAVTQRVRQIHEVYEFYQKCNAAIDRRIETIRDRAL